MKITIMIIIMFVIISFGLPKPELIIRPTYNYDPELGIMGFVIVQ